MCWELVRSDVDRIFLQPGYWEPRLETEEITLKYFKKKATLIQGYPIIAVKLPFSIGIFLGCAQFKKKGYYLFKLKTHYYA